MGLLGPIWALLGLMGALVDLGLEGSPLQRAPISPLRARSYTGPCMYSGPRTRILLYAGYKGGPLCCESSEGL